MAKSLPTPFNPPPPTTLLRWRHSFACAKRREFLELNSNTTNLDFRDASLGGSNLKPKFANLTSNLDVKKLRRSILR